MITFIGVRAGGREQVDGVHAWCGRGGRRWEIEVRWVGAGAYPGDPKAVPRLLL